MYKKLLIPALLLSLTACANKPTKNETASADDELTDEELSQVLLLLGGKPQKVDSSKAGTFPLGSSGNPVRVGGPEGQRNYLSRLVCDNNEQVSAYERLGSSDVGPYGGIMDIYEVICDTDKGAVKHEVFLDMYHHDYIETRPAAGFIGLKPVKK